MHAGVADTTPNSKNAPAATANIRQSRVLILFFSCQVSLIFTSRKTAITRSIGTCRTLSTSRLETLALLRRRQRIVYTATTASR
jgi:hypothetical protein